eukprot:7551459-Heterocapsa_arctica.AAC.1
MSAPWQQGQEGRPPYGRARASAAINAMLEAAGARSSSDVAAINAMLDAEAVSYTHLTLPTNREV